MVLAYTDVITVTRCLEVSPVWASHLHDIWRELYRYRKKRLATFRLYCGLIDMDDKEKCIAPPDYKRILDGGKKWVYFTNCSICTEKIPTCFKYHRNKLYYGTVEGELQIIDFGQHNVVTNVATSLQGRIFSIDVKDDVLVTGHGDGSLRFYPALGVGSSVLQVTSSALVLTKIISTRSEAPRLLCWARTGDCLIVSSSSLNHIQTIGRCSTEECFLEANENQIVVINRISLKVDIYDSTNGDFVCDFLLTSEAPVCSDMVGNLLFVGFKQDIEVWDLKNFKRTSALNISRNTLASLAVLRCNEIVLCGMLTDGTLVLWSLLDIFQDSNGDHRPQVLTQRHIAWRNRMEISDDKILFASERKLGDFQLLQRLK